MATFDTVWTDAQRAPSAVTEAEARVLYNVACAAPGPVVELGCWRGRSTVVLAHAVGPRPRWPVWSADPHEVKRGIGGGEFGPEDGQRTDQLLQSLGLASRVSHLWMRSSAAARKYQRMRDEPVALLWVDGDHSLFGGMVDWGAWRGLLAPESVVLLHDRSMPGPAWIVGAAMEDGWRYEPGPGSLAVLRR